MDRTAIATLLDQIVSTGKSYLDNEDDTARLELQEKISRLSIQLESPAEFVTKLGFAEPARNAALRTALELGIFDILRNAQNHAVSVLDITNTTGADATLIARLLKHLSAFHIITESSADSYTATPLSNTLCSVPGLRDGYKYFFDIAGPSFYSMPEYLKKTHYVSPKDIADGPFQYAHKTDKPFFLYLNERPESLEHFNNCMTGFRAGKKSWLDIYPYQDRISSHIDAAGPVIVDVGGGVGHDLAHAAGVLSLPASRCILQERPEVIASIGPSDTFTPQTHDFFTAQPASAQGAQIYFLHSVLHDWDDASCVSILEHVRAAMTPGYSKLIINEYVIPNAGATWPETGMDLLMMALGAVKERTEAQWEALFQQAGLKKTGVYLAEAGTEGVVEAVVA